MSIGLMTCDNRTEATDRDDRLAQTRQSHPQLHNGGTMQTMMLQFKHPGPPPTIDDVRGLFNLTIEEIDTQFGVLPTDPSEGLYMVLVDIRASERIKAVLATRPHDPAEGLFANPRVEPFSPPPTK